METTQTLEWAGKTFTVKENALGRLEVVSGPRHYCPGWHGSHTDNRIIWCDL